MTVSADELVPAQFAAKSEPTVCDHKREERAAEFPLWLTDFANRANQLIRKNTERFTEMIYRSHHESRRLTPTPQYSRHRTHQWVDNRRARLVAEHDEHPRFEYEIPCIDSLPHLPLSPRVGVENNLEVEVETNLEDVYAIVAAIPRVGLEDKCVSDEPTDHYLYDLATRLGGLLWLTDPQLSRKLRARLEECVERVEANLPKPGKQKSLERDAEVTGAVLEAEKSKYEALRGRFDNEESYNAHVMAWVSKTASLRSQGVADKINRELSLNWNASRVRKAWEKMRRLLNDTVAEPKGSTSQVGEDEALKQADIIIKVLRTHPGYTSKSIFDSDWYGLPTDTHEWTGGMIPPDLNGKDPTKYDRTGLEAEARAAAIVALTGGDSEKTAENAAKRVLDRWKRQRAEQKKLSDGVADGVISMHQGGAGSSSDRHRSGRKVEDPDAGEWGDDDEY